MNGQTRPQTESALENRELAGSQEGPFAGSNPCARGLGEGASRLDGGGCVPHVGFLEVRATSWECLVGKPWVGGNQAPGVGWLEEGEASRATWTWEETRASDLAQEEGEVGTPRVVLRSPVCRSSQRLPSV